MDAARAGLRLAFDDEMLWRDLLRGAHATGQEQVLRAVVDEVSARVALDEVMSRMAPETEALQLRVVRILAMVVEVAASKSTVTSVSPTLKSAPRLSLRMSGNMETLFTVRSELPSVPRSRTKPGLLSASTLT